MPRDILIAVWAMESDFGALQGNFDVVRSLATLAAAVGEVPAQTPLAADIAKALKAKGFKFCGPVIVYAFMQATGMVNDHVVDCFRHEPVSRMAGA